MAKSILFQVELEFESNIEQDEDVIEVARNIARAIVAETRGQGISPQNSDTYLEIVRVKPWYLDKTIIEHVY